LPSSARRRHDPFVSDVEGDFALEDVEALLFSAVDVRGRTAVRGHNRLPQRVLAISVLAGRQKPVYVTYDSNGAAFIAFPDGWLMSHVH
jgi:hypothetical protein